MLSAVVRLLPIKDLKALNNITRHRLYRHAGPTDLKRLPFLTSLQGGSPQPRHRRATSPYNLVNLANLEKDKRCEACEASALSVSCKSCSFLAHSVPGAWLGEGQALALRYKKPFFLTVARGPVPRVCQTSSPL